MTDPTPAEVIAFLNGERVIDGRWFGDVASDAPRRGNFWWRKYLPLLTPPATDAGEVRTAASGEWQGIESAPKDGTEFLAAWEDVGRGRYVCGVIAWIDPRSDGLDWYEGDSSVGPPKYWRPLPAPPAAAIRGLAR